MLLGKHTKKCLGEITEKTRKAGVLCVCWGGWDNGKNCYRTGRLAEKRKKQGCFMCRSGLRWQHRLADMHIYTHAEIPQ